ncbi:class I SAM-dependent methyltransferase [Hamadaea tsunoensis]|uniref:class I SAM-dependent methyltransferase n=1 Tax=Hamadaea tsunoensis TaxID=53368 RepID=UPI000405BB0C|nr:SAM-dependent methyltransferase [Hamadaea tsunoensis]
MTAGSAAWIAAVRARESTRSDRLFDDPYADTLAGPAGYAMMANSEAVTGPNEFIPVRVRWFDDQVLGCGLPQVVLLGAGLDTRAWRLPLDPATGWYEIDSSPFPAKETLGPPRCTRRFVTASLSTPDWPDALESAGFSAARPTLWVAEGLLFYLFPDDVTALLRSAYAVCAPGSAFVADVMGEFGDSMRSYNEYRAARGEPGPFGTKDPAGLFEAAGWTVESATIPGGPGANFGRFPQRPAGVFPGAAHLIRAHLP